MRTIAYLLAFHSDHALDSLAELGVLAGLLGLPAMAAWCLVDWIKARRRGEW